MSKYIRTKDAVYEVIKNDFGVCIKIDCMYILLDDIKDKIIDQADIIEELCDEFVGADNTCENGHQLLRAIPYKCANFCNGGVYGAIWTDKGLIYVAKMVDGKMVLI